MLPGTTVIYYGEETTQELFDFTPDQTKDLWVERDHFRLPMQWDDSLNAGTLSILSTTFIVNRHARFFY